MKRRSTILAALVAIMSAAPTRADNPSAPIKVPFEMLADGARFSGHIAIRVKINGKGPYRLIFDTGAPTMLLSSKVAKEAGLIGRSATKPARKSPLLMPGQVTIESLDAGDANAKDLPAIVLDHPTVMAIARVFGPIEGIVGFPFFARFRTSIDYQAKELTLVPNDYQPADVLMTLMTTLMARSADRGKPAPRVIIPAAQWGMQIEKPDGDAEAGVLVSAVYANSAASRAGLRPGDRLLTIDGRWTDSVADTFHATTSAKPGHAVSVVIRRGGVEQSFHVTPMDGF